MYQILSHPSSIDLRIPPGACRFLVVCAWQRLMRPAPVERWGFEGEDGDWIEGFSGK